MLKLVLDCDPDAAWRALRSPAVLREVAAPWLDFASREPGGFPTVWQAGPHSVDALALRMWAVGEEVIDLSFPDGLPEGVRMLRDGGGGRSGVMGALSTWDHRMAVSAAPGGKTLYRDRLRFDAGAITPAIWYPTWLFWQWRGLRLRQLAPTWRHDVGIDAQDVAVTEPAAPSPLG
ncbi:hypothetical protein WDJ51_07130 [Rathayibacter sp. YIM 133350]|uniref:hypothetical protein n=1 Tax=Rathayibacter sp. YIM 133350 TaxID=3131992 RepID=UPI00307EF83A